MIKYFNLNGITTLEPTNNTIISELNNNFIINNDNTNEIDRKLILLTHKIAEKLYGSVPDFFNIAKAKSTIYAYAGVDSDIKISKEQFVNFVHTEKSDELHKLLYYYDFQNLVGTLQNTVQESRFIFYTFYKNLNENTFMLSEKPIEPDIVMFASGRIVTPIFSTINLLFINLASQLDFITKIAVELENFPKSFNEYNKLKSINILYGDIKKIKSLSFDNTIFEKTDQLKLILNLRNEIVHNASIENIQKVYQIFKGNHLIEKYIYLPDTTNGFIDTFKNRNRFFNNEIKLNEILPDLIIYFWGKLELTIDKLHNSFHT